jgi:hypothetical protein
MTDINADDPRPTWQIYLAWVTVCASLPLCAFRPWTDLGVAWADYLVRKTIRND